MKNVYLMDYQQFSRLNLISPLLDQSLGFIKLRNVIEQQGGGFLEINNSINLERIAKNHSNGIIYQYATNKISKEQFTNAMSILFKLDNLKFIKYWESIISIEDLSLLALEELAKLQQSSEFDVHISGNLTQLNADVLNVQIAFTGLRNVQYTYSYTEGSLIDSDYVTKSVTDKYPSTEYNLIDLRPKGMLTPDIFKPVVEEVTPEELGNVPATNPLTLNP